MAPRLPLDCMASAAPILPGATVTVVDQRSIYNGYTGFVQRISGDRAAVLFEGGNWDKLVTLRLKDLSADCRRCSSLCASGSGESFLTPTPVQAGSTTW